MTELDAPKNLTRNVLVGMFAGEPASIFSREPISKLEDLKNKTKLFNDFITKDFITFMRRMYDYNLLQEIKECIYYYNKSQISKDILNYIYALSFDKGEEVINPYTNDYITVDDNFFTLFESIVLAPDSDEVISFRKDVQTTYISQTLAQEIQIEKT